MSKVSRRVFVGGAFAALLTRGQYKARATQKPGTDIAGVLGQYVFMDYEGKKFDVDTLRDKPFLLVFGFGDCDKCDTIATNLRKVKTQVQLAGATMPQVIMVDVLPDRDRNEETVEAIKERYGGENVEVLFTKDRERVQALQKALDVSRVTKDDYSHGLRVSVVGKDGICIDAPLATNLNEHAVPELVNLINQSLMPKKGNDGRGRSR